MKVTQISVTAGMVVNNPFRSFANLRPSLTLTADISDQEDSSICVKALQNMATEMVRRHLALMLDKEEWEYNHKNA